MPLQAEVPRQLHQPLHEQVALGQVRAAPIERPAVPLPLMNQDEQMEEEQ